MVSGGHLKGERGWNDDTQRTHNKNNECVELGNNFCLTRELPQIMKYVKRATLFTLFNTFTNMLKTFNDSLMVPI